MNMIEPSGGEIVKRAAVGRLKDFRDVRYESTVFVIDRGFRILLEKHCNWLTVLVWFQLDVN